MPVKSSVCRRAASPCLRITRAIDSVAPCPTRYGDPANHGGGLEMFSPHGSIGRLPPAPVIPHLDHIGQQHIIMRARIPGSRRGVPGVPVNQSPCFGRGGRPAPPAASISGDPVDVAQGRGDQTLDRFGRRDPVRLRPPGRGLAPWVTASPTGSISGPDGGPPTGPGGGGGRC